MKYLFGALTLLLVSCSDPFGFNAQGYEIMQQDLDTAWKTVSAMEYIPEKINYWKSPKEFFEDGGGDCEDFAIAMVYLLGPSASGVIVQTTMGPHGIVEYHGEYLEPQRYSMKIDIQKCPILHVFSYEYLMKACTWYGTKQLKVPH